MMSMREMVYTEKRRREVLYSGEYKDHKFAIVSLGTHPTAYVECKLPKCNDYEDPQLDSIRVHGGFTYLGTPHWDINDETMYVGWDYAHCGDYMGYSDLSGFYDGDKRWTTAEIFEEVKSVIDQLLPKEATPYLERDCKIQR